MPFRNFCSGRRNTVSASPSLAIPAIYFADDANVPIHLAQLGVGRVERDDGRPGVGQNVADPVDILLRLHGDEFHRLGAERYRTLGIIIMPAGRERAEPAQRTAPTITIAASLEPETWWNCSDAAPIFEFS